AVPAGERRGPSGRTDCPSPPATGEEAAEGGAVGVPWLEEMEFLRGEAGSVLPDRREVVQDPEAAAVRRGDQVSVLDREIVQRHRRQVLLEPLPVRPIVEGHPDAALGPGIEEPRAGGVVAPQLSDFAR